MTREYYEGRPSEDQFDRRRREDRELLETSDRIMVRGREEAQRKAEWHAIKPRLKAIQSMAEESLVLAHHGVAANAATRRATLHAHPVYKSLPERAQLGWDLFVDDATELILSGNPGRVREIARTLAGQQASTEALATWQPPEAERESPTELAAMIPRG